MNKENYELIIKIAERADKKGLLLFDRQSLIMDLKFRTGIFELKLEDFLNADDFNFSHDIIGIQNNFNRETKQMDNLFVPRFVGSNIINH